MKAASTKVFTVWGLRPDSKRGYRRIMEKIMELYIGLNRENGKETGNYDLGFRI